MKIISLVILMSIIFSMACVTTEKYDVDENTHNDHVCDTLCNGTSENEMDEHYCSDQNVIDACKIECKMRISVENQLCSTCLLDRFSLDFGDGPGICGVAMKDFSECSDVCSSN